MRNMRNYRGGGSDSGFEPRERNDGRGYGRGRGPGRGHGGGGSGAGRGWAAAERSGPGRRGGPRRARRGEVRAMILALLAEQPMHGYEMIKEIEERTGGVWKPSPGSIYPTLSMLEDEGLLTADQESGRRSFTLTEAGRAEAAKGEGQATPWETVMAGVSASDHSLRQVTRQVGMASRQVAEAGNEKAKADAVAVLVEARKKLYAILAEAD